MGDRYRPGRDRPPPLADRITFSGGRDNHRPGGGHEFSFESAHPAPRFPPASHSNERARAPRRGRGGAPGSYRGNGRNNANGNRRGGFRKAAPHERALLQQRDNGSPERAMGISDGPNRFLNPDDLSDDDEAGMETEDSGVSDDSEDKDQQGKPKLARTNSTRADGDSVPKWSNPDPYTVLPPPEEVTGKKTDFVKLIRKAKNQEAEKAAGDTSVTANDDFISFGDEDDHGTVADETEGSLNELHKTLPLPESASAGRPVPRSAETNNKHKASVGGIVHEWHPRHGADPTPWLKTSDPYAHVAGEPEKWLHNEIIDFYDFVAPRAYEHQQRNKLVHRVNMALGNNRFPRDYGRIVCFGSFPAGLYLPTADMDLVYVSDQHLNHGDPVIDLSGRGANKSILHKAARRLVDKRIAASRPEVIPARVPIIKFVDQISGLHVDISFENLSGVRAQATFAAWKREFPDMIYMVAVLKQFLVMRGLNEVHSGGIGGFTIICLIISYIQHNPNSENLSQCLLGFLKHYGNFDLSRYRIQMNPPAIVEKDEIGIDGRPERYDGLSIQDPNNLVNNISGGSRRVTEVFSAFKDAYDTLRDRMQAVENGYDIGPSILEYIVGGNYESYIHQRHHMSALQ